MSIFMEEIGMLQILKELDICVTEVEEVFLGLCKMFNLH